MTMECSKLKMGFEYPYAVRKVSWDELWHVQYYSRGREGKVYATYCRVKQPDAVRASRKLVNQYNELPKRLRRSC